MADVDLTQPFLCPTLEGFNPSSARDGAGLGRGGSVDAAGAFCCPAGTILRGRQANLAAASGPLAICGISAPMSVRHFSPRASRLPTKGWHDWVQSVRLIGKEAFCPRGFQGRTEDRDTMPVPSGTATLGWGTEEREAARELVGWQPPGEGFELHLSPQALLPGWTLSGPSQRAPGETRKGGWSQ